MADLNAIKTIGITNQPNIINQVDLDKFEQTLNEIKNKFSQIETEAKSVIPEKPEPIPAPQGINAEELREAHSFPQMQFTPVKSGADSVDRIGTESKTLTDFYKAESARLQQEKDALAKSLGLTAGQNPYQALIEQIKNKPSVDSEAKLKEAQGQYDVSNLFEQTKQQSYKVANLQGDLDKLEIQELADIERTRNQVGLGQRFINGQIGEIQRDYAIKKAFKSAELGTQVALLQAQQGNLQTARNMVSDVVNAYTYDISQERQDLDDLFEIHSHWIESLDKKEQDILSDLRKDLKEKEQKAQVEKTQIMNWFLEYPDAGIKLSDTLEEAVEKTRKAESVKQADKKTDFFTQSQLNKGAFSAGLPIQDFSNLDANTQNFFVQGGYDSGKKQIDDAKMNKENPQDIEREISESNLSPQAKDSLVKYLWSVFERPTGGKNFFQKALDWAQFWK